MHEIHGLKTVHFMLQKKTWTILLIVVENVTIIQFNVLIIRRIYIAKYEGVLANARILGTSPNDTWRSNCSEESFCSK